MISKQVHESELLQPASRHRTQAHMLGLLNFTSFMLTFDDSKVRVISKNPRFIVSQSSKATSLTPKIDQLPGRQNRKMESTKDYPFQDEQSLVWRDERKQETWEQET
jgi:hypothetical protein